VTGAFSPLLPTAVATLAAAATFALALNRRSWPLWLLAVALVVVTLVVAHATRPGHRPGPVEARGASARAPINLHPPSPS